MAFCTNCGKELPIGSRFCANCGTEIVDNQPTMGEIQTPENMVDLTRTEQQPASLRMSQAGVKKKRIPLIVGIAAFVLSIIGFIGVAETFGLVLSIISLVLAIVCLVLHTRLKGFPIAAIVISSFAILLAIVAHPVDKKHDVDVTVPDAIDSYEEEPQSTAAPQNAQAVEEEEENSSEELSKSIPEESTDVAESVDGVDPDLKAFLDSYEDFVDEYVDFMKSYMDDPSNVVGMLTEYTEIMEKYEDFDEAIDAYDTDSMSTADLNYYLEVTTRCTQKMLSVYGEE